jgi:hypothetical protein
VPKKRYQILVGLLIVISAISLYLGSAPPSPLYYLKLSRETIQSLFIFGDEDQANWYLTRADKRLTEAKKLKQRKLDFLADMQIETAIQYQMEAEVLLKQLKDKTNTTYLQDRFNQNVETVKNLQGN